jgi:hypothetical protein
MIDRRHLWSVFALGKAHMYSVHVLRSLAFCNKEGDKLSLLPLKFPNEHIPDVSGRLLSYYVLLFRKSSTTGAAVQPASLASCTAAAELLGTIIMPHRKLHASHKCFQAVLPNWQKCTGWGGEVCTWSHRGRIGSHRVASGRITLALDGTKREDVQQHPGDL